MEKDERYTLEILTRIEENGRVTQPEIARHLGISLGLTNAFIKRIARKGYIKLTTIPRHRVKYYLTPKGFTEKAQLTIKYLQYSLDFYKKAKERLSLVYEELHREGVREVVFYGTGEVAEIAYILLQENDMKLVGVVDEDAVGRRFMRLTVGSPEELKQMQFDRLLLTRFEADNEVVKKMISLGVGQNKIVSLKGATSVKKEKNGSARTV